MCNGQTAAKKTYLQENIHKKNIGPEYTCRDMACKARRKPGQGAGKVRIEKVLLETKVGQELMVFWAGNMEAQFAGIATLSLPRLWGHQKFCSRRSGSPGSVTAVCTLLGKLCSALPGVSQAPSREGFPALRHFDLLFSLDGPRLIL